jgi:hypothetical protein
MIACISDINGDEYVDWEEFTSFCIQAAPTNEIGNTAPSNTNESDPLGGHDDYIIDYSEDYKKRDQVLSSYHTVSSMKYVRSISNIVLIFEGLDEIWLLDNDFRVQRKILPSMIQIGSRNESDQLRNDAMREALPDAHNHNQNKKKVIIYDIIFLDGDCALIS